MRETIKGRELFDYAFKTYAQRWMFKHPTPADFFRTMEDASAVDLDWFWRGWFFTTDHVDISLEKVNVFRLNSMNPDVEAERKQLADQQNRENISIICNQTAVEKTQTEIYPELMDFYNLKDPYQVKDIDRAEAAEMIAKITPAQQALLDKEMYFYEIHFKNIGGLVMPLIVEFTFADGTTEVQRIPAEIWRLDSRNVSRIFITEKQATKIVLDPFLETADTDVTNKYWQHLAPPTRHDLFKQKVTNQNEMQRSGGR